MSRRSIKSITTIDYLENGKWAVFVTSRNSKKKKNETVATMTSESVVALVQRLKDEKFVLSPMAKYRLQDELVDSKNNHSMKITQEEIEQYISDSDIARLLEDNPPSDIDIDEKNEQNVFMNDRKYFDIISPSANHVSDVFGNGPRPRIFVQENHEGVPSVYFENFDAREAFSGWSDYETSKLLDAITRARDYAILEQG